MISKEHENEVEMTFDISKRFYESGMVVDDIIHKFKHHINYPHLKYFILQ